MARYTIRMSGDELCALQTAIRLGALAPRSEQLTELIRLDRGYSTADSHARDLRHLEGAVVALETAKLED